MAKVFLEDFEGVKGIVEIVELKGLEEIKGTKR